MIESLKPVGEVKHGLVYAPSAMSLPTKWQGEMKRRSLRCVTVPRKTGGTCNPNDMAISIDATRFALEGRVDAIALSGCEDLDFLYLVEKLTDIGFPVITLFQEGLYDARASMFQSAGAQIVTYKRDTGLPKLKAVVLPDGTGSWKSVRGKSAFKYPVNASEDLASLLRYHGYIESDSDPLELAFAKFCFVNALCPVTVWPTDAVLADASSAVEFKHNEAFKRNPRDLALVIPYNEFKLSAKGKSRYGSRTCGELATAGEPFILKDSDTLPDEVLRKLGYLDDDLNSDFVEACDVFCNNKKNRRNLKDLGIAVTSFSCEHMRRALLRGIFLSSRVFPVWQRAPRDQNVREFLHAQGFVHTAKASRAKIFAALQAYAATHGLVLHKTYNRLVKEVSQSRPSPQPCRRS